MGGYIDVMPVDKRNHYISSYQNGIFSERYDRNYLQEWSVWTTCVYVCVGLCIFSKAMFYTFGYHKANGHTLLFYDVSFWFAPVFCPFWVQKHAKDYRKKKSEIRTIFQLTRIVFWNVEHHYCSKESCH